MLAVSHGLYRRKQNPQRYTYYISKEGKFYADSESH